MNFLSVSLRLCGLIVLTAISIAAQIPAPKDTLGFTPGDDRKLASWASIVDYFKKLDAASDRMIFEEIGKSTMGAPFVYATISSPENLKDIARYRRINDSLADPRKITVHAPHETQKYLQTRDAISRRLIAQGKTIVLITCGIHSTEVGSTLSSTLIAHKLVSGSEPEIQKILQNTIILLVPSLNPDGVDIVKNWYDKTLGTPYEGTEPPELYHKYVGHDNNRDWYAFTQVETQLTVDKIHNVWHPQIVHDIHQQGRNGSRLFLPPYMQPVEPNVPTQIVEGFTELGNAMANDLRKKGFQGITTNSTYDAWTPARAYSHYHGGVRILSETASARLATPVTVKFDELRASSDDGYDPKTESANFSPVWRGGEWKLRDITNYMTTAAFSLLNHAADNRERWLSRFYEIGKEAVRPRKDGELFAFIVPDGEKDNPYPIFNILQRGLVEITEASKPFASNGITYPRRTKIIRMNQPYGSFAKSLLEKQTYPDLKDSNGAPISPYDVTAHTLPLLFNGEVFASFKPFQFSEPNTIDWPNFSKTGCVITSRTAIYKSDSPSMDEGWTRWVFREQSWLHTTATSLKIRTGETFTEEHTGDDLRAIIFPDQSAAQILNGYAKGSMPDEYTGGVGKEGVENLKKFVEAGGTLVFLNRASNFAIEQFNLPVKDVTRGLNRKDFYIPGSILRTELDLTHPIAKGMPKESIAWFENSPAFEIITDPLAAGSVPAAGQSVPPAVAGGLSRPIDPTKSSANPQPPATAGGTDKTALTRNFRIIATYPKDPKQILLSGWALGAEKIAGKAALVEFTIGKGKIVLFGFRPQYRGQSLATFPLLFNAISGN